MNWGYKILFVYLAFVVGIMYMVFRSSTQKSDLVTKDYYAQELKYQDKINELGRTAALSAPVKYEIKGDNLVIDFPPDFTGKKLVGEVVLYCPSDENKDIKMSFTVTDESVILPVSTAQNRLYEMHLTWQDGGVGYYFEKKIVI